MSDRWQELAASRRKPKTLVVNLYGGPGTGKSTTAAEVFSKLKQKGVTAELVTEVAKDFVWEKREKSLEDQVYIFGKQYHRLWRLLGEVDVIVTDGPLLLSLYYARQVEGAEELFALTRALHGSMRNLDLFIVRDNENHPYNERGRYQDLAGARSVDDAVLCTIIDSKIPFRTISIKDAADAIVEQVEKELRDSSVK